MSRRIYDVRAHYGGGRSWVVRCTTLPGLLWFLLRARTGRLRKHPDWPDEVLRYEIVGTRRAYTEGWDPIRLSHHLTAAGLGAEPVRNQERMEKILEILEAAAGLDDAQLDDRLVDYLVDPPPYRPPGCRSVYRDRKFDITTKGLWTDNPMRQ